MGAWLLSYARGEESPIFMSCFQHLQEVSARCCSTPGKCRPGSWLSSPGLPKIRRSGASSYVPRCPITSLACEEIHKHTYAIRIYRLQTKRHSGCFTFDGQGRCIALYPALSRLSDSHMTLPGFEMMSEPALPIP